MLEKYFNEFKDMYQRMINGEKPLEVIRDYSQLFEEEGIGAPGIAHYLTKYAEQNLGD